MTFRTLVFLVVFAGLAGAQQKFSPIYATPAARAASENYAKKRETAIAAQQNLEKILVKTSPTVAATDPTVVAAKADVVATATEAKAAATTVLAQPESQAAPADKVQALELTVTQIKVQAAKDESSSSALYMWLTIGAIGLALASSISGFLKQSVWAGILSLCAAAIGGAPKALDLDGKADFYQQLYDGANSLATDIQFDVLVTVQDYNGYVKRLDALEAHTAPDAAKSRDAATALMNELLAAKSPSKD